VTEIKVFDRNTILNLIDRFKHASQIKMGSIVFNLNLANCGSEEESIIKASALLGGLSMEKSRKAAILTSSIESIAGDDGWTKSTWEDRFNVIYSLQPMVLDFMYDAYLTFRSEQEAKFKEFLAENDLKKPSPNQNSDTSGDSSESQED